MSNFPSYRPKAAETPGLLAGQVAAACEYECQYEPSKLALNQYGSETMSRYPEFLWPSTFTSLPKAVILSKLQSSSCTVSLGPRRTTGALVSEQTLARFQGISLIERTELWHEI